MGEGTLYFLALHLGQVAQVALASVQHCIPQEDLTAVLAQQACLEAQPDHRAEAQTITATSFRDFI